LVLTPGGQHAGAAALFSVAAGVADIFDSILFNTRNDHDKHKEAGKKIKSYRNPTKFL
jgi:hypothetical protein